MVGLLLASSVPEYPLGRLRFPALTEPADPIQLTDLNYQFSQGGNVVQGFESRIRLGSFAFLAGEVRNQRRRSLLQHRAHRHRIERRKTNVTSSKGVIALPNGSCEHEPRGALDIHPYREPHRTRRTAGGFSTPDGRFASIPIWRSFWSFSETLSHPLPSPPGRCVGAGSASCTNAAITSTCSPTCRAHAFERKVVSSTIWGAWRPAPPNYRTGFELESVFTYTDSNGRLASSGGFASIGLAAELGRYVVARASASNRWEPGVKWFEQDLRGGVTFYVRPHHFFRGGEVGSRVLALTRRAYELGYNERRVYDLDALRALRERLSLSARAQELAAELDEVYRAQVRERNVPQAGFELVQSSNDIVGGRLLELSRICRLTLAHELAVCPR